jgi:hypothetical protein
VLTPRDEANSWPGRTGMWRPRQKWRVGRFVGRSPGSDRVKDMNDETPSGQSAPSAWRSHRRKRECPERRSVPGDLLLLFALRWPLRVAVIGVGFAMIGMVAKPLLWAALFDLGPSLDVFGNPLPPNPFGQMARTVMSLFPLPVLFITVGAALYGMRTRWQGLLIAGLSCLPWFAAKVWGEPIDVQVMAYGAASTPLFLALMALDRIWKRPQHAE